MIEPAVPLTHQWICIVLAFASVCWCIFHIWKPFFSDFVSTFSLHLARSYNVCTIWERECNRLLVQCRIPYESVQGSYLIARSWLRMPRGIDAHGNSLQNTLGCHLSTLFNLSQGIHTWFTVSLWFWEKKMVNLNSQFARVVELMNSKSHYSETCILHKGKV